MDPREREGEVVIHDPVGLGTESMRRAPQVACAQIQQVEGRGGRGTRPVIGDLVIVVAMQTDGQGIGHELVEDVFEVEFGAGVVVGMWIYGIGHQASHRREFRP